MPDYFSRSASVSPFLHPLSRDWAPQGAVDSIDTIYAQIGDGLHILEEFRVSGDHVGFPSFEFVELLQSGTYHPSVWFMQLSADPIHSCAVFAPQGFDIESFRHDLMLLLALGVLGKFCNRTDFLNGWEVCAKLLTGDLAHSDAQGWWHRNAQVIVVSFTREQAHVLSDTLLRFSQTREGSIIELDNDRALINSIFEKAAQIFLDEINREGQARALFQAKASETVVVSPIISPAERANQAHAVALAQIQDEEGS